MKRLNSSRLRDRMTVWISLRRQSCSTYLHAVQGEKHRELSVGVLVQDAEEKGHDLAHLEGRIELAVELEDGVHHHEVRPILLLEESQQDLVDHVKDVVFEIVVFEVEANEPTC